MMDTKVDSLLENSFFIKVFSPSLKKILKAVITNNSCWLSHCQEMSVKSPGMILNSYLHSSLDNQYWDRSILPD